MKYRPSRILSNARSCVASVAILLLLLVATERPAKAYVDPGSGALVWQGILATLLGVAFYFRRSLAWVKGKISKTRRVEPSHTRLARDRSRTVDSILR